jgi:RNA polymerase sigma-70 factor (ECF subfamily)
MSITFSLNAMAEYRLMGYLAAANSRMLLRDQPPQRDEGPSAEGAADLTLVQAAVAGDAKATDALVERLAALPAMLRLKNARLGSPLSSHEIDDAAQNVLMALWQKLRRFDGRVPVLCWAYGFALVEIRRTVERRARRREREHEVDALPASAATPALDSERVAAAIDALPADDRQIVRLKHFAALTFEEIAAETGALTNTVKTKYYRALQRLRERLTSRRRQEERDDA